MKAVVGDTEVMADELAPTELARMRVFEAGGIVVSVIRVAENHEVVTVKTEQP